MSILTDINASSPDPIDRLLAASSAILRLEHEVSRLKIHLSAAIDCIDGLGDAMAMPPLPMPKAGAKAKEIAAALREGCLP